jgi:hypothetical protein
MLKFNSDAPYVMPDIPITMVVVQVSGAVTVSPGSASKPVFAHKYASYDFTIVNTSGATDSFDVSTMGFSTGWIATLSSTSITNLANGASANLNVKMSPPATAKEGDEGVLTLNVHVHDNPGQAASFSVIATVKFNKILVPIIKK